MANQAVYVATHSWDSPIRVGSHHVARALAAQYELLYLSHPISLASIFSPSDNQLSRRLRLLHEGMSGKYSPANIREMNFFMPFAPGPSFFHRSNLCVNYGSRISLPNPVNKLREAGFLNPKVLWQDSLFQSFWSDLLQPEKICVRIADHPEHITSLSEPLRHALYNTLDRASLIITPAKSTADYLRKITSQPVHVIPNGVEIAHFREQAAVPAEYLDNSKPKVVFIGALANWIDIALIATTAEQCPSMSFFLIGPNHNINLKAFPANVHYLGSKAYSEIPGYLQHADVAIAPFDVERFPKFIESVDAIKLYEYLAAGIPVVATQWSQSKSLEPFVIPTEQTAQAFSRNLNHAIRYRNQHVAPPDVVARFDWSARLEGLDSLG